MDNILHGLRILIVEDEFMIALDIQAIVTDLGCTPVGLASSVSNALAVLEQVPVDAALLDINLQGTQSFAVADTFQARGNPSRSSRATTNI